MTGTLYVVATPLGNLQDASLRMRKVLAEVDLIVAEDTRVSRNLLQALGLPHIPMISSFEGNEAQRAEEIACRLQQGISVALVTDAGTPCISDPGDRAVAAARDIGAHIVPVPGPCAVSAALSVSGFPASRFYFEGFLPAKGKERSQRLEEISKITETLVLYESPHRLAQTLHDLAVTLGNERKCVLCRELTKHFETILSGTLGEMDRNSSEIEIRGEITLVIEAAKKQKKIIDILLLEKEILRLRKMDLAVRMVAEILSPWVGISKSQLYEIIIKFEKENEKFQGE